MSEAERMNEPSMEERVAIEKELNDEKHITYAEAIKQMQLMKYGIDRHAPKDSVAGIQDGILRTRAINKAISALSALRAQEQNVAPPAGSVD